MRKSIKELKEGIKYLASRINTIKDRVETDEIIISDHSYRLAELNQRLDRQTLILDTLMGYLKVKAHEEEELVSNPPNSYIKKVWKIKKSK